MIGRVGTSRRGWLLVGLLIAAVDVWGSRYNLNPDGISYLEMAQHSLAGGPQALLNGYWSPGYPILIVPVLWFARRGWSTAIPALHLINFLLYLVALGFFLRILRWGAQRSQSSQIKRLVVPFGVAAFSTIAIQCIGLGLLTPDVGVLLSVLLTAWCCLRLESSIHPWRDAARLGVVLGAGYWIKGILLPVNGLLVVGLLVVPPRVVRARAVVLAAAGAFLLVSLPLIAAVSHRVGHASVGEVGRLNYAWEIDDVTPFVGWLGDSAGHFGTPLHPPRIVQQQPQTLEFATPIRATYPLWYEPSYWYAGVQARFDATRQLQVLQGGVKDVGRVLLDQWAVVASVLAIWLLGTRAGPAGPPGWTMSGLLAGWSGAAVLMYAAVHVEARYLAGFVAVGVVAAWCVLAGRSPRKIFPWVMAVSLVALTGSAIWNILATTGGFAVAYRPDYILDADRLRALGIGQGEPVATVGDAFEQYAPFVAGNPIAAQVTDSAGFWELSPDARSGLQARLAQKGIRALLANNVDSAAVAWGWHILSHGDGSNIGVRRLDIP